MVAYAINCVHTYSIFPLRILKLNPRNFFWNSWKKCKSRTESNDSEGGCRGEAVRCEICAFRSLIPIDLTQTLNWKWVAICSKSTFLNKIQSNFEEQKAKRSKIPPATRAWSIYLSMSTYSKCITTPSSCSRWIVSHALINDENMHLQHHGSQNVDFCSGIMENESCCIQNHDSYFPTLLPVQVGK